MSVRLITGDDLCLAFEQILIAHLPAVVAQCEWLDLTAIATWEQVPTLRALSTAVVPAGLITSPGLVEAPLRRGDGSHDATWRVMVGIWDRDATYRLTASRARRWAAAVRTTMLAHQSLDGVASGLRWVSEEYDEFPNQGAARTLGGCAVAFDVDAKNVVDLSTFDGSASGGPPVTSTPSTVSIR